MHENIQDTAESALRQSQIALHSIALRVAQLRQSRAERVEAKMEHKIELYNGIGNIALRGSYIGERPQNLIERLVELRIERRAVKKHHAFLNNEYSENTHGKAKDSLPKSIAHTAIEGLASDYNVPVKALGRSVGANTVAFFKGPDVPGMTNLSRKIGHIGNNIGLLTGKKSVGEWRIRRSDIKTTKPKHGNKAHRITRRGARRRNESFDRMTSMPISSAWRESRLDRAQKRQVRLEEQIMNHHNRLQELHN